MTDFFLIVLSVLSVLASRLINLKNIPIFTDEAIYIRWAQIGLNDPAQRYISLTDGKQPLLTWLMYPFLQIFSDPLIAGRLVSITSGCATVVGLYLLTKALFNRTAAVFSVVLYLISPFTLLYDRLALMDSLLAASTVFSLYLQVVLIQKLSLDISLLLGMVTGLGLLTKSSAFFSLYLLPFSLILGEWHRKKRLKIFLNWTGFAILSTILAQIMYNSLRLSPYFYIIEQKNYSFIMTLSEFLARPFMTFWPNLYGLFLMLVGYLSWPLTAAVIVSLIFAALKKERATLFLFLWFLIPFFALAVFGKVLFPRFLLFMVMPLFPIAARLLEKLVSLAEKKSAIFYAVLTLFLLYPAYNSFLLLVNPLKAAIPETDKNQLLNDWPSGYGTDRVIDFAKKQSAKGKIVLATEGTFGLNPAVYEIYLQGHENIKIKSFWPVDSGFEELSRDALARPTYLVLKESQKLSPAWVAELIFKIRRGKGDTYLYFYEIKPSSGK